MAPRWIENAGRFYRFSRSWSPYARTYFSQEGEDILLSRLFSGQRKGFYVDVGAHHPERFSNTLWAYRRGWSGINIDASTTAVQALKKHRPRDVNLQLAVSDQTGSMELFEFQEPALNTVQSKRRDFIEEFTEFSATSTIVKTATLAQILEQHLHPANTTIDFMSIDVEGNEAAVLASNDWGRFHPRVVVLEVLGRTLSELGGSDEVAFLSQRGYTPVAMLYHSVLFVSDDQLTAAHWGADHRGGS